MSSACERTLPIKRFRLSEKIVPTFADRGCRMVSATDLYGHILGFLDWSRYFFLQVTPQLYSRGRVDPVSDPLLLRKSGSARNRIRTSKSPIYHERFSSVEPNPTKDSLWRPFISTLEEVTKAKFSCCLFSLFYKREISCENHRFLRLPCLITFEPGGTFTNLPWSPYSS
jgi:hypothetical protein